LRRTVGDTRCWVVVGGSNDVGWVWAADRGTTDEPCNSSEARRAEAQRRIDLVLDKIRMNRTHQVYWVNVNVNTLPDSSCIWNTQLERIEGLEVIDWHSLVDARQHWFLDNVHTNRKGDLHRARLVIRSVR
jgi:hypothetical protein